jgi:hypothetical protein
MRFPIKLLLVFSFAVLANLALAHHNMTALFDFNDRVTLNGPLTAVDWRNPHIYLTVGAKAESGETESWQIEGPSPSFFRIRDLNKADFESSIGKSIMVELSRSRDHSKSGLIRTLKLPNGKIVSACPQNC